MEENKYQMSRGASIGLLVVLALLYMSDMMDRYVMSIALTPIKQAFGLTDTQAGMLPSLVTFGMAIFAIPVAIFGDRWSRRKIVSLMSGVWSIFTLVTAISTQFWHVAVARFMVGSGEAGFGHVGSAWLSVAFKKEIRSRVMAIYFAIGQLGTVVGLMVGGIIISATHDWRSPFYIFAIPGIILAIIVFFMPDYKTVRQTGEAMLSKAYFKGWGQVFKIKTWWLTTISAICIYFMIIPMGAWMPTLMIRAYNMTPASAGMAYGLILLVFLLGPVGGILVDRWYKKYINARPLSIAILSVLSAAFVAIAMLTVGAPLPLWLTFVAIGSAMYGLYMPIVLCVQQDVVPIGLRATSGGVWNFIIQLTGSTLGPIVVGAISDAVGGGARGIQTGMLWMVPVATVGAIACFFMLKYYPSDSCNISEDACAEK
jgi:MFS family permease